MLLRHAGAATGRLDGWEISTVLIGSRAGDRLRVEWPKQFTCEQRDWLRGRYSGGADDGSPDLLLITAQSGATLVTEADRTWLGHTFVF